MSDKRFLMTEDVNRRLDIQKHFDDSNRIAQDMQSYGVSDVIDETNIDPYEALRESLLCELIDEYHTTGAVMDIGCGIGHLVKRLRDLKYDCDGFDLSNNMVQAAKEYLLANKYNPEGITCSDIFTFQPQRRYALAVANGVIWYYESKQKFLECTRELLAENGVVIVVHRNDLFNVFALNQGTLNFYQKTLYADRSLSEQEYLIDQLTKNHPTLTKAVKVNSDLVKPYDNPLDISTLYEKTGFKIREIAYTYIHPFPPMMMNKDYPYDYEVLQKNYGRSWQGALMGSQFIVVAEKK